MLLLLLNLVFAADLFFLLLLLVQDPESGRDDLACYLLVLVWVKYKHVIEKDAWSFFQDSDERSTRDAGSKQSCIMTVRLT